MKRGLALVTAAAILAAPTGALAGDSAKAAKVAKDDGRMVMRDFAKCLVGKYSVKLSKNIDAFLAMSPYAAGAGEMGRKLAIPDCLSSRYAGTYVSMLRMAPPLLRGALFHARYERQFARRPVGAFAPYDVKASWHVPLEDQFAPYQAIGECAVRADPGSSRAVMDADIGSKAEDAAFAALVPALQKCMPQNGTYRFSRAVLEGLLAEALYNLSATAVAPAPVESK